MALQSKGRDGRQAGQGQRGQREAGFQRPELRRAVLPADGELRRCTQNRTAETIEGHDPGGLRPRRAEIPSLHNKIAVLGQLQ